MLGVDKFFDGLVTFLYLKRSYFITLTNDVSKQN
jgi:hypothetical protein